METADPAASSTDTPDREPVSDERKTECAKEVDLVYSTINSNQEEYDKQLLTLSSGFLALSLAFIKDVVPFKEALHRWMLYTSYGTLTCCVLGVLLSYQISIQGLFKAKTYWEEISDGKTPDFPYGFAKVIRYFNWSTGVLFATGVFLTVSFVVSNLHTEVRMEKKIVPLQEGQQMKTPAKVEKGAHLKSPAPSAAQHTEPKQQSDTNHGQKPERSANEQS